MGVSMKEGHMGTVISVGVHLCVMVLLMVPFSPVRNRSLSVVVVDFSLNRAPLKEVALKVAAKTVQERPGGLKDGKTPGGRILQDQPIEKAPGTLWVEEQAAPLSAPAIVTEPAAPAETEILPPANVQSEMVTGAVTAPQAAVSLGVEAGDAGDHRSMGALPVRHGSGDGSQEWSRTQSEKGTLESLMEGNENYNYIRDAVMENIRYPDRARRMGFEGKILLSFVVLEDGTTTEIRVIHGSCYRILDDSAKEAVAQTRLVRTMPYRIVVRLPITFKLQRGKDGRT